jgi:hypothetical protein
LSVAPASALEPGFPCSSSIALHAGHRVSANRYTCADRHAHPRASNAHSSLHPYPFTRGGGEGNVNKHADTDASAHVRTDPYADTDASADIHADPHSDANRRADLYIDANQPSDADRRTDPYIDVDQHANADTGANAYIVANNSPGTNDRANVPRARDARNHVYACVPSSAGAHRARK